MSESARRPPPAVSAVGLVAVALFAVPLAGLLSKVEWSTLVDDLSSAAAVDAVRLSLVSSIGATAISVGLGLPLAWVLARANLRGRSFVRSLVLVPMVLPPVVGGVALLSAFSRTGLVGEPLYEWFGVQLTFTLWGAVLAEVFVAMPFFVITVEAAIRGFDARYEDAAASLGARRWVTFGRVILPQIRPAVVAGAVLTWARALGEFGATITFAGNIAGRTQTLPLAVYLELEARPDVAVALSLVLLAVSLVVIVGLRERWLGTS